MTGSGARAGAKPAPADLGIDPATLDWERSGDGDGSIEIAFPAGPGADPGADRGTGPEAGPAARRQWTRGDWVLMRVAGDPAGRILVFDRNEWECFLDGVRNGEFDDAAGSARTPGPAQPAGPERPDAAPE